MGDGERMRWGAFDWVDGLRGGRVHVMRAALMGFSGGIETRRDQYRIEYQNSSGSQDMSISGANGGCRLGQRDLYLVIVGITLLSCDGSKNIDFVSKEIVKGLISKTIDFWPLFSASSGCIKAACICFRYSIMSGEYVSVSRTIYSLYPHLQLTPVNLQLIAYRSNSSPL